MREYETLYLVEPEVPAEKLEAFNLKLAEIIKSYKGEVLTQFNWGKRRLAYVVDKHQQGIYIYLNYLAAGAVVNELERILKYDDSVLKYITVKLEENVDVEKRLQEKREPLLTTYEEPGERPYTPREYNHEA